MSDKPPGKRVLLVDDDHAILTLLGLFLVKAGYAVECVTDGSAAWRRFQEVVCDIVVTDRMMPSMSGDALAQRIKSAQPEVPLILITGFMKGVPHPQIYDARLVKPFHAQELLDAIERSFRSKA